MLERFLTTIVVVAGISGCGKAAGPEPRNAKKESTVAPASVDTLSSTTASPPEESGRGLRYAFVFTDAISSMTVCADGPYAVIDQQWHAPSDGGKKHWGADSARIIFDSANHVLTVINLSQNTYVKLDEARMARAAEDLEKGTPVALGNLGAATRTTDLPAAGLPPLAIPLPSKQPKKKFPEGCDIFDRDLPKGLREETCFKAFDESASVSDAFAPLISMAEFTAPLAARVRDLETAAAVAEALGWDTGIPTVQYKYGDSPFEEDNAKMEAWDRTFTLEESSPCSVEPNELDPPEGAVQEFGLLPWNTPFIVTALPE